MTYIVDTTQVCSNCDAPKYVGKLNRRGEMINYCYSCLQDHLWVNTL
jgi:hypothetical protein